MRCTVHVTVGSYLYTKRFFSAIVVFLEVVIKDKIVKFSKHCGTSAIKESGGGGSIINGSLNSKIIIINYQNSSGKSQKFSRSRMTKQTAPLSSSREI